MKKGVGSSVDELLQPKLSYMNDLSQEQQLSNRNRRPPDIAPGSIAALLAPLGGGTPMTGISSVQSQQGADYSSQAMMQENACYSQIGMKEGARSKVSARDRKPANRKTHSGRLSAGLFSANACTTSHLAAPTSNPYLTYMRPVNGASPSPYSSVYIINPIRRLRVPPPSASTTSASTASRPWPSGSARDDSFRGQSIDPNNIQQPSPQSIRSTDYGSTEEDSRGSAPAYSRSGRPEPTRSMTDEQMMLQARTANIPDLPEDWLDETPAPSQESLQAPNHAASSADYTQLQHYRMNPTEQHYRMPSATDTTATADSADPMWMEKNLRYPRTTQTTVSMTSTVYEEPTVTRPVTTTMSDDDAEAITLSSDDSSADSDWESQVTDFTPLRTSTTKRPGDKSPLRLFDCSLSPILPDRSREESTVFYSAESTPTVSTSSTVPSSTVICAASEAADPQPAEEAESEVTKQVRKMKDTEENAPKGKRGRKTTKTEEGPPKRRRGKAAVRVDTEPPVKKTEYPADWTNEVIARLRESLEKYPCCLSLSEIGHILEDDQVHEHMCRLGVEDGEGLIRALLAADPNAEYSYVRKVTAYDVSRKCFNVEFLGYDDYYDVQLRHITDLKTDVRYHEFADVKKAAMAASHRRIRKSNPS